MTAEMIIDGLNGKVNALRAAICEREEVGVDQVVELVLPMVRELAGQLVSTLCDEASRYDRADCPTCEQPMQRRGRRPRTVNTWFGPVSVLVPRLRCADCGAERAPLLERSQIRCDCTPEVWTVAVEEATRRPYRDVERLLARFGLAISDSTVEALVQEVGGQLTAVEAAIAESTAELRLTPRPEHVPERLYVSVDARSVRVNHEWRELKVAVIYETPVREPDARGRPPAPERVASIAYFGSIDEFFRRLYVELVRRGLHTAKETVLLGDGATWIWERLPALMPLGARTVQILDFFHAAENLNKAVVAVHGEGSATGRALYNELRGQLKLGNRCAIVARLKALHAQAATPEASRIVHNVIEYVRRHWQRMSYLRLRSDGYHLGSGVIESQCKRLGQRVKGPGMNWSPNGLAALLALDNHGQRSSAPPLVELAA